MLFHLVTFEWVPSKSHTFNKSKQGGMSMPKPIWIQNNPQVLSPDRKRDHLSHHGVKLKSPIDNMITHPNYKAVLVGIQVTPSKLIIL